MGYSMKEEGTYSTYTVIQLPKAIDVVIVCFIGGSYQSLFNVMKLLTCLKFMFLSKIKLLRMVKLLILFSLLEL